MNEDKANLEVMDGSDLLDSPEPLEVATDLITEGESPDPVFQNPTFDKFFRKSKLRTQPVEIDVDGETYKFIAHEMSVAAKGRFEAIMFAGRVTDPEEMAEGEISMRNEAYAVMKAKIVATTITTEDGQPICAPEQWTTLAEMPSHVIEPLFQASFMLSGLGKPKESDTAAENE